jgi:hypothetical protein
VGLFFRVPCSGTHPLPRNPGARSRHAPRCGRCTLGSVHGDTGQHKRRSGSLSPGVGSCTGMVTGHWNGDLRKGRDGSTTHVPRADVHHHRVHLTVVLSEGAGCCTKATSPATSKAINTMPTCAHQRHGRAGGCHRESSSVLANKGISEDVTGVDDGNGASESDQHLPIPLLGRVIAGGLGGRTPTCEYDVQSSDVCARSCANTCRQASTGATEKLISWPSSHPARPRASIA